jgi:uroporphyrinogen decarboxylase
LRKKKLRPMLPLFFSDLLLIVEPFGLKLEYLKSGGPQISKNDHKGRGCEKSFLKLMSFHLLVLFNDAIKATRNSLKENIPLIGFSGCPFTLASYMIEGGII